MVERLFTMRESSYLLCLLAALGSVACTAGEPGAPGSSRTPVRGGLPSSGSERPAASQPAATKTARVAVTGTLVRRDDEIEICPGRSTGPCPGIQLTGVAIEQAWLSEPDAPVLWRLTGNFDGSALIVDAPAQRSDLSAPDYRNRCPEFQAPKQGVNPDERLSAAVEAFVSEHRERVAGQWWDRERQTMVVWVTGDETELRRSFAARARGARVCIQGQARFSQPDLEIARARADRVLAEEGIAWSGSSLDVVGNRVVYEAEAIDRPTLARLAREAGESIRVLAFIELLDQRLTEMPAPPTRGDVALLTEKTRSAASVSALGRFSAHYDAERRCVYLQTEQGERLLPVWPFGYWATSNPMKVFDYDGNAVAESGDTLEFGGGEVDVQHVRSSETCGAKKAWIGYPPAPTLERSAGDRSR